MLPGQQFDDNFYGQQRSCARKRRYINKPEAKQAAKLYPGTKPYLCQYCGVFHIGHRHGAEWER